MEPTTTPESRNIFIQVNTDAIIGIFESGGIEAVTPFAVRENTIIYDQGSMALGNPILNFNIGVEARQDIHFTILPLQLFSFDKLYFTEFKVEEKKGIDITTCNYERVISFSINTGDAVEHDGYVVFTLKGIIEYKRKGVTTSIEIDIDPVLRVIQRAH